MQKYQFTVDGKVKGPFDLDFIEALFLCRKVTADTVLRSAHDNSSKRLKELRDIKPLVENTKNLKTKTKSMLWICIFLFTIVMTGVSLSILGANNVFDAPRSRSSSTSSSSYSSSSYPSSSRSTYQSSTYTTPSSHSTYTAPSSYSSSGSSYSSSSGSSRTRYSVSSANNSKLEAMQAGINLARSQFKFLEEKISEMDIELSSMKSTLDRTSQVSIDIYNEKIRKRNALYDQYKTQLRDLNSSVDAYNNFLHQVGR